MEIYVLRNGQKMGPYTPDEVRSSLAAGSVQPTDLGWQEGAPDWQPISSILGFGADMPPAVPRQTFTRMPEPLGTLSGTPENLPAGATKFSVPPMIFRQ